MRRDSPPVPGITGVGQAANKDPTRILHPIELLERAARQALDEARIEPSHLGGIMCTPLSSLTADDPSAMLADRLSAAPGARMVSSYSGAAPQVLIAEACRLVRSGEVDSVLVAGGIADASVKRAVRLGLEPPAAPTSTWSQGSEWIARSADGIEVPTLPFTPERAAGAGLPAAYFALVQSSLCAGQDPDSQRRDLAALLAPFTTAAASRPDLAWFPVERAPEDIAEVTAANRMIAQPFTKLMCSFPTVDLAAALVVARVGVDSPTIRPLALTSAREASSPAGWADMGRPAALARAVERAISLCGDAFFRVAAFDLYSCFPTAVSLARRAIGMAPTDPRPLTVTGGLPYFGGPGASYSLHGVVCMVEELRRKREATGMVVGVGGMIDSFSVGIYGTGEEELRIEALPRDPAPAVPTAKVGEGPALVEAMTVIHDRQRGPVAAPVIVRLPDGRRLGARAAGGALPSDLAGTSLVGEKVRLTTSDGKVFYDPEGIQ